MRRAALFLPLILLFPTVKAAGYELVMKDGTKIEGTLITEREDILILKNASGVLLNFKKSDVDLEKTTEANKEPVKPTPKAAFQKNEVEKQPPVKKPVPVFTKEYLEELRKKYDLGQGSFGAAEKIPYKPETIKEKSDIQIDADFKKEVLDSEIPVLVDFWASWCGPCKQIAPTIEEVENDFEGKAKVYRVNIDSQRELSQFYDVEAIPTLLFFKNGEIAQKIVGLVPKEVITAALQPLVD
jgi:thioredoxin 1